jgi:hypothetical protein
MAVSPMMMLRLMSCFLREAWLQGFPGLLIEPAPAGGFGAATGAAELMPAPPSSVTPSGIPARPAREGEGRGDGILALSAQESCAFPENPPPSNGAVEGAPLEPMQFAVPMVCEGSTGLMPGVAISVEPSGMPAGRVDPVESGDVAPMPLVGGWLGDVVCANTGAFDSDAMPTVNDA